MQIRDISQVVTFAGSASAQTDRGAAGVAGASAAPAAASASVQALKSAIMDANTALRAMNRGLEFELDPASGKLVTRLIDTSDNEVLRQIPSEEMLRIAEALDRVQGLLLEHQA
ncbi:MAG TPA: flagellar protein FlaG [Casimicrobiaceae bacterium]|jgi:flagellar protein FlaG|nr:flagellar protein FlaG [Casimicrobiaceae bacterium]